LTDYRNAYTITLQEKRNEKEDYMKSKKILLMMLVFAVAGFTGIFAQGAQDEAAEVKLTWWAPTFNEPRTQELADKFMEANPGITVELQSTAVPGLEQKVLVAMQSGSPPDLVDVQLPWVLPYASRGLLEDLTPYIEASDIVDPDDFFDGVWGAVEDGGVYAIPNRSESHAFIYNKGMYREAGLDPNRAPKDWDELLEYSKKLTDRSKGQSGIAIVGGGEVGNMVYNLLPWIWANGGDIFNDDYTEVVVNEAAAVEAVDFYTSLFVEYKVTPPTTVQNGGDQNRDLFAEEKVAQFQAGSYVIEPINQKNPDIELGFGLIPPPVGKKPAALLGGWANIIPKDAKNKEAAWKFAEFLASPENMAYYTDTFPPTASAMENPRFDDPRYESFIAMMDYVRPAPPVDFWLEAMTIFQKEVQEILLERKTAQEAMDDAAAAMSDLL